jgi:hypothetical protein
MATEATPKGLLQALDLIRGTKAPRPEALDVLESRQVDRVRTIFEDPNIVAIGIAQKRPRISKPANSASASMWKRRSPGAG